MTYEELRAKIHRHCPGARVIGGAKLATLRRQQLRRYAKDPLMLPPVRPVTLSILGPDDRGVGIITVQFDDDGQLTFHLELTEAKHNER